MIMSKKSKQPEQNVEVKQEQIQEQIVEEPKKVEIPEQKFPTELLVKSEKLAQFHLHRDVIRAILTRQEYTLSDAIAAIKKYIDSFNV
jgi:cupin superfamily acireductone dioxygenase involved in methionine salvage